MHPVAFEFAGYSVRFAGLSYILAVLLAGWFADRAARSNGWDRQAVLPGLAIATSAAYLGARVFGAALDWDIFVADPIGAMLRPGALGFFGGLALGSAACLVYLKSAGLPVGRVCDALSPVAPWLYAVFRVGCFLNGDDYGRPSSMPWALAFPEGSPPTTIAVHPTQLYEILMMVPVAAALWWSKVRQGPPGTVAFDLCFLMGAERLLVEQWRDTLLTGPIAPLAPWFAASLVGLGVGGRLVVARTARRAGMA